MITPQDPVHDKDDNTAAMLATPDDMTEADVAQAAAEVASSHYVIGQRVWIDDPGELRNKDQGWIVSINHTGLVFVSFATDKELAMSDPYSTYAEPFLATSLRPTPPDPQPPDELPIPLPEEWTTRPGKPATPAPQFEIGSIVQVNETEPDHYKRVGIVTKIEFTGEYRVRLLEPEELEWFDPEALDAAPGKLYFVPDDIPLAMPMMMGLCFQWLIAQTEMLKLITNLRYQLGEHQDSNIETALQNEMRSLVQFVFKLAAGDPEVSIKT